MAASQVAENCVRSQVIAVLQRIKERDAETAAAEWSSAHCQLRGRSNDNSCARTLFPVKSLRPLPSIRSLQIFLHKTSTCKVKGQLLLILIFS